MTVLNIIKYPDPRLRLLASEVGVFDERLTSFVSDLAKTMYVARGVGLAAIQVGVLQRILVIDVSADRNELLVLINPRAVDFHGRIETDEGCLSVPDIYEPVARAERISYQAQGLDGSYIEGSADGLLGVCIQHEVDHLDGKLFVDRLSHLKRDRIRKRCLKRRRQDQDNVQVI